MAQNSDITADVNLRRLVAFCKQIGLTPDELIEKDSKQIHSIFIDFVAKKSKEKNPKTGTPYAGSYIHSTVKAVKSWLAFNDITVKKVNVKGSTSRPTLDNEIVPTQAELKSIFMAAPNMRDRVSCALIGHAGLRLQTLGNYSGTDGLKVSDFPEMVIEGNTISFKAMPTRINVRENLSKAGHQYFTFLSEEGCEYLKAYLEYRLAHGETMTPESDIIHAKTKNKQFITTINVGDGIRGAIRNAGFKQRPYVLRSYFDTQLMVAESKGKIPNQYRMFFMGHVGNMEARYTTNKRRLPEDVIEDMREAYKRAQAFLQTGNPGLSEDQVNQNLRKQSLILLGFSAAQLDKMNLGDMSEEDIQTLVRDKLMGVMINNGNSQKLITGAELDKYLSDGWVYVDKVSGGKVIVKIPR